MRIEMHTTAAGPDLPFPLDAGKSYDVEDDLGAALVEAGAASELGADDESTLEAIATDAPAAAELPRASKPRARRSRKKAPSGDEATTDAPPAPSAPSTEDDA